MVNGSFSSPLSFVIFCHLPFCHLSFCLLSFVFCLLSFVFCLLSFCHLSFVFCHFVICHLSFIMFSFHFFSSQDAYGSKVYGLAMYIMHGDVDGCDNWSARMSTIIFECGMTNNLVVSIDSAKNCMYTYLVKTPHLCGKDGKPITDRRW